MIDIYTDIDIDIDIYHHLQQITLFWWANHVSTFLSLLASTNLSSMSWQNDDAIQGATPKRYTGIYWLVFEPIQLLLQSP